MTSFVVRRLLQSIPLVLLISLFAFVVIRLAGDPMSMYGLNPNMTAEDRARIITEHGWDRPLLVQYLYWLRDTAQGDWGRTYSRPQTSGHEPTPPLDLSARPQKSPLRQIGAAS